MRLIAALAALFLFVAPAAAQSPEEVEERVIRAAALFTDQGFDAFCAAVSDPEGPYLVDEAYVFALTRRGALVCHPRPDLLQIPTGAPSAAPNMLKNAEAAQPSGAWTRYPWPHPFTQRVGEKSTFCIVADPLVVCAGIFFAEATS